VDEKLTRIKQLIELKEATDAELFSLIGGGTPSKARKPQTCGTCGQEGHTARTCPQKGDAERTPA
jgi:hypothetical protein